MSLMVSNADTDFIDHLDDFRLKDLNSCRLFNKIEDAGYIFGYIVCDRFVYVNFVYQCETEL